MALKREGQREAGAVSKDATFLLSKIGKISEALVKLNPLEPKDNTEKGKLRRDKLQLRREFLALLATGLVGPEPATVVSIALNQLDCLFADHY